MTERTVFSLNAAARITGKSKGTVSRALQSGRLSYRSHEGGQYQIEAAELFRVFPATPPDPVPDGRTERSATPDETEADALLSAELRHTQERLSLAERTHEQERRLLSERIAELRQERDDWKAQAGRLLLSHERPTAAAVPERPAGRGWRFLGFEVRRAG